MLSVEFVALPVESSWYTERGKELTIRWAWDECDL